MVYEVDTQGMAGGQMTRKINEVGVIARSFKKLLVKGDTFTF